MIEEDAAESPSSMVSKTFPSKRKDQQYHPLGVGGKKIYYIKRYP